MSRQAYIEKMTPYAKRVASAIGVHYGVVLSHWILETGSGSSALIKRGSNNHAGIKANSSGRDFVSGAYAGYNSINSFVNDYIRLINTLPYYKGVKNQTDPYKAIDELHKSPWAEDKQQDKKLIDIFNAIGFGSGSGSGGKNVDLGNINVDALTQDDLKKYAFIGLGVVALISLSK